jgi:hypothetical protein
MTFKGRSAQSHYCPKAQPQVRTYNVGVTSLYKTLSYTHQAANMARPLENDDEPIS